MKHLMNSKVAVFALAVALSGCASAPEPSPRLLAAEAALQQAKIDPATMESGRSALQMADTALVRARQDFEDRKTEAYTHQLRMGESYIELAETRGRQRTMDSKLEALKTERAEIVSDSRMRQVASAQAATGLAEIRADQADLKVAKAQMSRDAAVAELADYEQKRTAMGTTLIVRDLQFATGSSALTKGAQARLAPLASFRETARGPHPNRGACRLCGIRCLKRPPVRTTGAIGWGLSVDHGCGGRADRHPRQGRKRAFVLQRDSGRAGHQPPGRNHHPRLIEQNGPRRLGGRLWQCA